MMRREEGPSTSLVGAGRHHWVGTEVVGLYEGPGGTVSGNVCGRGGRRSGSCW